MPILLIGGVAALLSAAAAGPRNEAERIKPATAFDLYSNNILVSARLNSSEPALFIVDTGAAVSVVDAGWASQIGLETSGAGSLTAGGGDVAAQFAQKVTVGLAGLEAPDQLFAVVDLSRLPPLFGRAIRGILGNTLLKDYVLAIDYAARELALRDPRHHTLSADPDALPVENRGGIPYVELHLDLPGSETITGYFEIDSGSSSALNLNRPYAHHHCVLERVPPSRQREGAGGAGIGGDMRVTDARIQAIRWGPHRLAAPVISVSRDAVGVGTSEEAGYLGGEILRRFTVELDYRARRVRLTPNAAFNDPFLVDLSGLEFITNPEDFRVVRVKTVRDGFPAARAGLRVGDIVARIDDTTPAELGLDAFTRLLMHAGATYRLEILRGAETFVVELALDPVL